MTNQQHADERAAMFSPVRCEISVTKELTSKDLIHAMYEKSLRHIRAGTASYKDMVSEHDELLRGSTDKRIFACFCPRSDTATNLPPRDTWCAGVSLFLDEGAEHPYLIIDTLRITLPTAWDNFGDQLDLAVTALTFLKNKFPEYKVLYPSIETEKALGPGNMNYAVSKYAVRKVSTGTITITVGPSGTARHFVFNVL